MPDVQLVVIGDSAERSWLETDAAERGLGNVRFLGPRLAAQMPAYVAWADVLLLQTPPGPLADISIPPKMYSYLASGRPILASAGGEVAALIRETEAGIVAPPGSGEALAEGVRVLHDLSAEERHQLGENGRRAFAERFQRDRVVHRYEKVFKTAIAQYEGAGSSRREQLYEGEE
jgi:glycosyltransferase involved in cell wall biosynthesis